MTAEQKINDKLPIYVVAISLIRNDENLPAGTLCTICFQKTSCESDRLILN